MSHNSQAPSSPGMIFEHWGRRKTLCPGQRGNSATFVCEAVSLVRGYRRASPSHAACSGTVHMYEQRRRGTVRLGSNLLPVMPGDMVQVGMDIACCEKW